MTERNKGILLMIISSLFFAIMATFVRLSGDLPTIEKVFFRNLVGLVTSSFLIFKTDKNFKGSNTKLLIYRSILGLIGIFLYFYAIDRLPLGNAVVLNQMNPFFVIIFSAFFLKEKIKKPQGVAIAIALVGVVYITRPEINYTFIPALTGLLSAVFAAGAYTMIRELRLTDSPQTIVFYFTGITTIVCIPFLIFGEFVIPSPFQLVALLLVGVFATLAQFFMTNSYRYAEAGDLSIYSYGNTIFSTLIGVLILGEVLDLFSLLGISLILIGAYINYLSKK